MSNEIVVPRRFQLSTPDGGLALSPAEREDPFWQQVAALQTARFYRSSMPGYVQELNRRSYHKPILKEGVVFGLCADGVPLTSHVGKGDEKSFNILFSGPDSVVALGGVVMGDISLQASAGSSRRVVVFTQYNSQWEFMIQFMYPGKSLDVHVVPLPLDEQKKGYDKSTALLLSYLHIEDKNFPGIVPADLLDTATVVAIDGLGTLLQQNRYIYEGMVSREGGKIAKNVAMFAASGEGNE